MGIKRENKLLMLDTLDRSRMIHSARQDIAGLGHIRHERGKRPEADIRAQR
jgi:hypothetical protein